MMNPKPGNRKKVMYVQYRLKLTLSDKSQACFLGRFRQGGANHIGWGPICADVVAQGQYLLRIHGEPGSWGNWYFFMWVLLLQVLSNFIEELPPLANNGFDSLSNYVRHRKLWKCIFGQYVSVGWLKVEQLDNSGDSCLRFTRPPP